MLPLLGCATYSQAMDPHVISVFGSSVANGAYCGGNCSGKGPGAPGQPGGCYQSRLRVFQAAGGTGTTRSVFNNCHGGDTTTKLLDRFDQFVSSRAAFVVIGLSLANEGLPGSSTPQKVYDLSLIHI